MGLEQFKYIITDDKKRPQHSLDTTYNYKDVKDKPNLAIAIERPYVIIDADDADTFEIMCKIIRDKNLKTRILKTTRGGHFWFSSRNMLKNVVHASNALTLKIDVKSWGKKTMEVIKLNNEWREWLQYDEDVDEIPFYFIPVDIRRDFLHYKEGDGRNDGLFKSILPYIGLGFNKLQIREIFDLINKYVFDEPLEEREIDAMLSGNEIFENTLFLFYDKKRFLHNKFADYIINEYQIKGYSGDYYAYINDGYTNNKDLLASKMLVTIPSLNQSNIKEVLENIRLKTIFMPQRPDMKYVNVSNGLVNVEDGEFIPHTSEKFVINKIDCAYNPDIYSEEVYSTIKSLACDDEHIITLLIQMLGYCLLGDCRFQKSFILLGNGRNGKSMFLEMIRSWLGDENCSSLALEDLSERFRTAELVGKLVNIGDDSGNGLLENTAIFKKLVTGDSITVERKNQQPFKYTNKAKMIFAVNALPPTTDKSDGFFRRCIIIPFNAIYRETDPGYDENKIEKLITSEAKSYLLNLALVGLQSLFQNKKFDIPDGSRKLIAHYESVNNNILMWYQDINPNTHEKFENMREAYANYCAYCASGNYRAVSISKFSEEYVKIKQAS